jgi:hypothetical protein
MYELHYVQFVEEMSSEVHFLVRSRPFHVGQRRMQHPGEMSETVSERAFACIIPNRHLFRFENILAETSLVDLLFCNRGG